MHCVLLKWHPMLGLDFHNEVTATVPPAYVENVPHVCGHVLYGWGLGTVTPAAIKANGMQIVMRGSDISNGIIHVPIPPWPPICLLPLVIGFSGSKSHFGPGSVKSNGNPIGAAILVVINLNLNCNSIAPLPTGIVIAPATVVCGMTLGDILGGVFAMASDAIYGFILNKITGGIGSWVAGDELGKVAVKVFADVVSSILQTAFGSPLGWSLPGGPTGRLGNAISDAARGLGERLGNWASPPQQYGPHGEPLAPGQTAVAPPAHALSQPFEPGPLPADHPAADRFNDPEVEELA